MKFEPVTFGPEEDGHVSGELIVKLTAEGGLSVTESIPPGPARRVAGALPNRMGIDSLDDALNELGVVAINKVHGPMPAAAFASAEAGTSAQAVNETYRLRFEDPEADLSAAANRLSRFKAVAEVSMNFYRYAAATPNDPKYGIQWGLTKINCPAAWDKTVGSAAVVVAVLDTGVDLNHPELQAQLLPGRDLVDLQGVAPNPGWHFDGDFLTPDNDPQDEVGHGTHVAGTIGALSNNGLGVAGVAWQCRIVPVKVLTRMVNNADPRRVTGVGTAVDIAAGIRWAADNGAHILNMSLGGYSDTFVERDAVAYAVSKGCLVIAAMGNDDIVDLHYPAAYPDVVAVGATNQNDKRVSKANTANRWGSNMGPHIDVVGPGIGIESTYWDDTYASSSGTSMATPHVTGVAVLIKACKPAATASEIAQILRDSARNLKDDPADPVPNDRYGFGLVDAEAAVKMACPPPTCRPFGPRPFQLCWPYSPRPVCRPIGPRPSRPPCGPFTPRPVCRPWGPSPRPRCRPIAVRPTICRLHTPLPIVQCNPNSPPPYDFCQQGSPLPVEICPGGGPRPYIECPGGGPRPSYCPGGGPQPFVECPGGTPQPFIPCAGPRPNVPPVIPDPRQPGESGAWNDPYGYGYGSPPPSQGWGYYDPSEAYGYGEGSWGEYDPTDEYGYEDWSEDDWSGYDPWYG